MDGSSGRRRSNREKYEVFTSPAAAELRRRALGSDVANGYTTREQAQKLTGLLRLSPGDRLLDVGGGRGWPGRVAAGESGAGLVTTDLPDNAAVQAAASLSGDPALSWFRVVRADGRALPFADGVFDGVCHADVLC